MTAEQPILIDNFSRKVMELLPGAIIIPLKGYSKMNPMREYNEAKKPKGIWKGAATMSEREIRNWVEHGGWVGAIIPNGRIVVDVDDKKQGDHLRQLLLDELFSFSSIETPNGWQFIFNAENEATRQVRQISGYASALGITIDTRVPGKGYIVFPTKNTEGRSIQDSEDNPSELPKFLHPIWNNSTGNYLLPLPMEKGGRNSTLFDLSRRLFTCGLEKTQVEEAVRLVYRYFVLDHATFPERELETILKSAYEKTKDNPKSIKNSASHQILQKSSTGTSYFEGTRFIPKWLADEIMKEVPLVFDGNRLYRYREGVYRPINDFEIRVMVSEKLDKDSRKSHVDEVLHYIKTKRFRPIEEEKQDTETINVLNGLLKWQTGELNPHSTNYFSTIQLPVRYDPEAKAIAIEKFMGEVLPHDTLPMLYEWFGYSMIPTAKYHKAIMLTGNGSNGKSKLIELYEKFIGTENISNVPLQDLEGNRFKLAQLYNKLANTFADIPAKSLDKSSVFKTVVSGDRTSAEFKGRDSFDFRPFARLLFSANELPRAADLTEGFFRRWLIIPFPHKFGPGGKVGDPNIMEKLLLPHELSGLLNLALEGLRRLDAQGDFTPNKTTEESRSSYRKEIDNVTTFVDECCIINPNHSVGKQDLYSSYCEWCHDSGYRPTGKNKFYKRLEAIAPVESFKQHAMPRKFIGIGIIDRYTL